MKPEFSIQGRAAGMAALAMVALSVPAFASDVRLSPHRAVYDITLSRAAPGSGVAGLSGRMVFELNGSSCDGYTQNMRFVTRMTNQEGVETINDLRASSFEEAAGKRLRFSSTQYQNEDVAEASQGDAVRKKGATGVVVDLTKPVKKKFDLPNDVFFPAQHAIALISAARSGQRLLSANLYDGSEKGDKYYVTTAIIGNKTERGAVKSPASFAGSDRLANFESWPLAISYFEPGKEKQDSAPAYELAFRYYENGVTANLGIDYGEFAIAGEMKELTFLDAPACAEAAH